MLSNSSHLLTLKPGSDLSKGSENEENKASQRSSSEEEQTPTENRLDGSNSRRTKKARLCSLKQKAKAKTKSLLTINDAKTPEGEDDVAVNLQGDPAFNPGFLRDKQKKSKRESVVSAAAGLSAVATSIISPKDAIKGKATRTTAGKLSKVQRPYLSKDADLEFLEAHNRLDRVESSRSSRQTTSDDDRDSLIEGHKLKIEELKAHRESLHVAWTTTRFVTRARVVPKRHLDFPDRSVFVKNTKEKRSWARYDWLKWIGHVRKPL